MEKNCVLQIPKNELIQRFQVKIFDFQTPPSSVPPSTSPVKLPLWTSPRRRSASESAENRLQAASTSTPVSVPAKPVPLWTSPRRRSASDLHDSDQKTATATPAMTAGIPGN